MVFTDSIPNRMFRVEFSWSACEFVLQAVQNVCTGSPLTLIFSVCPILCNLKQRISRTVITGFDPMLSLSCKFFRLW